MDTKLSRNGEPCPACGEGKLTSHVREVVIEHAGVRGIVPAHYSACDYCGSELAGPAESQANKRAAVAFRKCAEQLLLGSEIKAFRSQFELTQDIAAKLFGGGKVAFSRYENDEIVQSEPMDSLLRLCRENPMNLLVLAKQKSVALSSATVAKVNSCYPDQLLCIAPLVQRALDADLLKQTNQASRKPQQGGHWQVDVQPQKWKRAA